MKMFKKKVGICQADGGEGLIIGEGFIVKGKENGITHSSRIPIYS
jgi:hypothetical protein